MRRPAAFLEIRMDGWQRIAAQLIREIAPHDVADRALYLVDFADLQAVHNFAAIDFQDTLAFTHRRCDLMLRTWLESIGQWQGRGFAAVVRRDQFGSLPDLLGCVLHEFSHALDHGLKTSDDDPDNVLAKLPPHAAMKLSRLVMESISERVPPWFKHEERFIRASCHLAYRAGQVLECVKPSHLKFASHYHRQPYHEAAWMTALASELTSDQPIRSILATPAPAAFTERWRDATSWFK